MPTKFHPIVVGDENSLQESYENEKYKSLHCIITIFVTKENFKTLMANPNWPVNESIKVVSEFVLRTLKMKKHLRKKYKKKYVP